MMLFRAVKYPTILLLCVFFIFGCQIEHVYTPTIRRIRVKDFQKKIKSLHLENEITIINNQKSDKKYLIGRVEQNLYYGSLKDITESVVQHARNELNHKGIRVNENWNNITKSNDNKILKVSVISARCCDRTKFLGTNIRSEMLVSVETSSGIKQEFPVEYETPLTVPIAYDGAAMQSVIDIFSNDKIIQYIGVNNK